MNDNTVAAQICFEYFIATKIKIIMFINLIKHGNKSLL